MQMKHDDVEREVPIEEKVEEGNAGSSMPLLGIGLAVLFASAAFFSGYHMGNGGGMEANLASLLGSDAQPVEEVDMAPFWEVWHQLDEKFVSSTTTEPVSDTERLHGAIKGLVDSYGDPYTVFMTPVESEVFNEEISGNFSGVGMEVGIREGVLTVIAPLPDSPAEKAGLLSGDFIIRIDNTSTEGLTIDEAVQRIRGEAGTEVVITVVREGESEVHDIKVVRDVINVPTIKTELKDGVFIITLYSFNALAESEMQKALREYVESGADKMIIDLRGNPGGFLQSAVSIASYFLPTGKVVVRENFGENTEEHLYRSTGKSLRNFAPKKLVVLVDKGSASASEILAGALQEHGVATLVGTQTYGKGSVQELVDLDGGASLKVTIARWLTPNGISISAGGLTPDIVVERTPQQMMAKEDPQLEAALKELK